MLWPSFHRWLWLEGDQLRWSRDQKAQAQRGARQRTFGHVPWAAWATLYKFYMIIYGILKKTKFWFGLCNDIVLIYGSASRSQHILEGINILQTKRQRPLFQQRMFPLLPLLPRIPGWLSLGCSSKMASQAPLEFKQCDGIMFVGGIIGYKSLMEGWNDA